MVNLTELQNKSSVLIDEVIQVPRPNTTDKHGRTLPDLKFVPIIERVNNRYHIKLIKFVNDLNHKQICGYMYFTYDADEKISEFFGVKVEKKISFYIFNINRNTYIESNYDDTIITYKEDNIFEVKYGSQTDLLNLSNNTYIMNNVIYECKELY